MKLTEILAQYEPVIGLECHVELRTQSKMFCGCSAEHFGVPPNTHTCPVCLGLPGALPTANQTAIDWCLQLGLALNCTINKTSRFDRKNYAYPDLPKGYQISQNEIPFCSNGWVDIELPETGETKRIRIHRIHLEEDTAKLQHVQSHGVSASHIDFNRSGVPLIEIVTEPDIHSAVEAKLYLTKLRDVARYLGISTADMDKGAMRMEPNISLRKRGETALPPYKVEVKNINSFRFVANAINFELNRHVEILETGKYPPQETRGWNTTKSITYSQRLKENAGDYRYFPEPDLPPITFSDEYIENIRKQLPQNLEQRMADWAKKFGILPITSRLLLTTYHIADTLENIFEQSTQYGITPTQITAALVNRKITTTILDDDAFSLSETALSQEKVRILEAVKALYSFESLDESEILAAIESVVSSPENAPTVQSYKNGKTQVIGFFIGRVVGKIGKKIDASVVKTLLEKRLSQ